MLGTITSLTLLYINSPDSNVTCTMGQSGKTFQNGTSLIEQWYPDAKVIMSATSYSQQSSTLAIGTINAYGAVKLTAASVPAHTKLVYCTPYGGLQLIQGSSQQPPSVLDLNGWRYHMITISSPTRGSHYTTVDNTGTLITTNPSR